MRVRRHTGAMVGIAALLVLAPRPVAAVTVAQDVKFMEFNYCGPFDSCDGSAGVYHSNLRDQILAFRPSVVAINEICRSQYERLRDDLAGTANPWAMYGKFEKRQDVQACDWGDGNKAAGIAILTRSPNSPEFVEPLTGGNPTAKLLCVTTDVLGVDLAACVTHLAPDNSIANAQAVEAKQAALTYANQMALFLAGDFNIKPDANGFDDYYAIPDGGNFEEIDQCSVSQGGRSGGGASGCNRYTHINDDDVEKKLDYMFFKQAWAGDPTFVDLVHADHSDHDIYLGTIDICDDNVC